VFSADFLVGILSNTWKKVLSDPSKYLATDYLLANKILTYQVCAEHVIGWYI
jgi:hypothetical protein